MSLPKIPCVILAGGRSTRFGTDKALAPFRGQRMIDFLIDRLTAQTDGPIVINSADDTAYGLPAHDFITDRLGTDLGPLAGLHAALHWAGAHGYDSVITSPVDTPLLPDDFISRLEGAGAPCVVRCGARLHAVHGFWPVRLKDTLAAEIENGLRAARDWCKISQAIFCDFSDTNESDPFVNVNRPRDLAALQND